MIAQPALPKTVSQNAPLVVAGLFSTASGIGEGARTTYRALKSAGLNPIAVDLSEQFAPVDLKSSIVCQEMPEDVDGTLILQLNAPETPSALQHLGMNRGRKWYVIGYWAWELPSFPSGWEIAFRYLSEIWTVSSFSAAALRLRSNTPSVHVFGHAITPPDNIPNARTKFGWRANELVFLTMADSMSSLDRKNPFASIRAFKNAFGNATDRRLIVKTRNLDSDAIARARILDEIGDAENIDLIDKAYSEEDLWALIASVDGLISLHRSEGYGLTLAEAMAVGTPVICTDWSGNMDFANERNTALTRSTLIPCHDGYGVYSKNESVWAEPDEHHATQLLQRLAVDQDYRNTISRSSIEDLKRVASVKAVGSRMAKRLDSVRN